jgi:hypothetical protein
MNAAADTFAARRRLSMRNQFALAAVVTAAAVAVAMLARSSVQVTNGDITRAAVSPYEMMLGARDLPIQPIDQPF